MYTVKFAKQVADDWENAFLMLAQAHVQSWYQGAEFQDVQKSYKYALGALSLVRSRSLIPDHTADSS